MTTILVVDDRAVNREFLSTLLSYGNYTILEAENGAVAYGIIQEKHPDLVITDILMPTMNGYEMVQKMRGDPDLINIPIIFYTATYRLEEAKLLGDTCGVKYILSKPSDPQVILDTVNFALGDSGKKSIVPEIFLPGTDVPNSPRLLDIDNLLKIYLSDLENIKNNFNNFINKTQKLMLGREEVIRITEQYSHSLKQLRSMCGRLVAIVEFDLDLISEREPTRLLRIFINGLRKITDAKYAILGIFENNNEKLKYFMTSGIKTSDIESTKNSLNSALINSILKTNNILNIDDIRNHPGLCPGSGHPTFTCLLGLPIFSSSELRGFLYLADKTNGTFFNKIDIQTLGTLATELSVLYENIELYDIIQRHAAQLQVTVHERKISQEKLEASLVEKDVMLKEIYHRVKNNLQVVSSLLHLQAKTIKDPVSKKIFIESSSRIKAMALIHEMLYQSSNLARIDISKYIQSLLRSLQDIYHIDRDRIKITTDIDKISLTIEDAIPCGLIINELISNSFKHAFPSGKKGEIKISIKNIDNHIILIISDNGTGLSEPDLSNATTLGMQLIFSLTKQVGGTMKIENKNGMKATLKFLPDESSFAGRR